MIRLGMHYVGDCPALGRGPSIAFREDSTLLHKGSKGIGPIAAEIHAKAPHLRPMETGSRDFDFRDGFLRRVLVRQQPFNEARKSVSPNGRLMGRSQQATTRGVAESPRTRA
jgi:hypothetical protein